MGAVFKVPYTFAPHWPEALSQVKAGGYGLLALHLQGSVEHTAALGANGGLAPSAAAPAAAGPPPLCGLPLAVVVGAEYEGVGEAAARLADERVRIAMAPAMAVDSLHGVDSLNVNVAAAIVLERIFAFNRAEHEARVCDQQRRLSLLDVLHWLVGSSTQHTLEIVGPV
ncbi:hypothetical protein EMIHUDRAFT_439062 [Emiliania huxleyi CCMP1516]|uniref:tRNA/rRNA methyltransferase SpoU type domain-containing protein n=2 Tax=Emiliania huxleyi TaxID=2903 RepID=A0A0D3I197_EMIH1|nr:hypothetical protein EMIHUDRAFT_439062 [Emiliania huxleyi CCMP1516]EOD05032.1 hypothetical protein EMIHUDRAFT_439062 [Emiliania huxleyi CCMP1516]|eukprot:XP_005757461.1 hypothetical protein EMIHUDRAFT_439062 [Emiliania huxleyi CCMP1516]